MSMEEEKTTTNGDKPKEIHPWMSTNVIVLPLAHKKN